MPVDICMSNAAVCAVSQKKLSDHQLVSLPECQLSSPSFEGIQCLTLRQLTLNLGPALDVVVDRDVAECESSSSSLL